MTSLVERKDLEDVITERQVDIEIPPEIERKEGIIPRKTVITSSLDVGGGQKIGVDDPNQIFVTLPTDEENLKKLSRGSIGESITWFASFWIRIIKKALHFGWRIIRPKS